MPASECVGTGSTCAGWASSTPLYPTLADGALRLVRLKAGAWEEPLDCELRTFNAESVPPYIALSYVWGNLNNKVRLQLNCQDFNATENLYHALRRIRAWDRTNEAQDLKLGVDTDNLLWIWADAICIDQNNTDEKSSVIPRMGEIYHNAERVICWLGSNEELDDSNIQLLFDKSKNLYSWFRRMGYCSKANLEWYSQLMVNLLRENVDELKQAFRDEFGELYDPFSRSLQYVMTRPYFSRIWTVQESVLAQRDPLLVLGNHVVPARALSISQRMFSLASKDINTLGAYSANPGIGTIDILRIQEERRSQSESKSTLSIFASTLYTILGHTACGYECTLAHDILYAVLGLAHPPKLPNRLLPRYNFPVEDVYREYARFIIEETGDLNILEKCRGTLKNAPSWVPDFRLHVDLMHEPRSSSSVFFTDDGRRLNVMGVEWGKCVAIHDTRSNPHADSLNSLLRIFEAFLLKSCEIRKIEMHELVTNWLEMLCRSIPGSDPKASKQMYDFLKNEHESRPDNDVQREHYKALPKELLRQVELVIRWDLEWPWAVVDDGSMVAASYFPVELLPNDIVCMLKGCRRSVILRPAKDAYLFICTCLPRMGYPRWFDQEKFLNGDLKPFALI